MSQIRIITYVSVVACCLAIVVLQSCSCDQKIRCQSVTGQLLVDGKPYANAMVILHPLHPKLGLIPKPSGVTDVDGRFQLTTFEPNDGAPPGKYLVTVEQAVSPNEAGQVAEPSEDQLPPQYTDVANTDLTCEVRQGQKELSPIKIQR